MGEIRLSYTDFILRKARMCVNHETTIAAHHRVSFAHRSVHLLDRVRSLATCPWPHTILRWCKSFCAFPVYVNSWNKFQLSLPVYPRDLYWYHGDVPWCDHPTMVEASYASCLEGWGKGEEKEMMRSWKGWKRWGHGGVKGMKSLVESCSGRDQPESIL